MFEKHGLDISVANFTSGKQCLDTVIGGGADIATTAEAPVTAAAMANQPIAFIAGMEYSDLKTITAAKAGIKTKADLRGKKIGFTAGTGSEVYTATLLKAAGLTPADVTLVNLRPQEMLPAMAAGSIDAFDTWEPHIANARKTLGESAVLLDTKGLYSETFNIVVTRPYLDANGPLVDKFLRALVDAEAWLKVESGRSDHDHRRRRRHEARRTRRDLARLRLSCPYRRSVARHSQAARGLEACHRQSPAGRDDAGFQQGAGARSASRHRSHAALPSPATSR